MGSGIGVNSNGSECLECLTNPDLHPPYEFVICLNEYIVHLHSTLEPDSIFWPLLKFASKFQELMGGYTIGGIAIGIPAYLLLFATVWIIVGTALWHLVDVWAMKLILLLGPVILFPLYPAFVLNNFFGLPVYYDFDTWLIGVAAIVVLPIGTICFPIMWVFHYFRRGG